MTYFSTDFIATLKQATLRASNAIGTAENAAAFTRVQKTQINAYTHLHQPAVVPLDVALDLDQAAHALRGHTPILSAYAGTLGFVILPLHVGPGDFGRDMSEYSMVSGEMVSTAIRILEDGVIDPQEANEIAPKMAKTKHVLERALARIHTIQQMGKPYSVKGEGQADG